MFLKWLHVVEKGKARAEPIALWRTRFHELQPNVPEDEAAIGRLTTVGILKAKSQCCVNSACMIPTERQADSLGS